MLGLKSRSFEETLPYYSIEENKIILQDGRVALGYKISPVEMERWETHDYRNFNELYIGAMRALPVGTVIQKLDIYYHQPFQKELSSNQYFKTRFYHHFQNRLVLFHKSFLFISFAVNTRFKSNPVNTYFALGKSVIKNPFVKLESRKRAAEKLGEEFVSSLNGIGELAFTRLPTEELERIYQQYFNLDFPQQAHDYDRSMNNQLSHFEIGERKLNVISLKGQGNEVHQSVRNHYNVTAPFVHPLAHQLNFPHVLVTNFLIEDTEQQLRSLDLEKKLNASLDFLTGQDHQIPTHATARGPLSWTYNTTSTLHLHIPLEGRHWQGPRATRILL